MTLTTDPYPPRQRRASHEDVRRRVLHAARREFAAKGFDGVSLDQIAGAAGFSKGAVYSNFATKSDLFLALMDESVSTHLAAAREAGVTTEGEARSVVVRRLASRLNAQFAGDDEWQLLLIEFWMRAMRDDTVREPFREYRRRFRRVIADEFERVLPGGDTVLSSLEVATSVLALTHGIAIERMLDPEAVGDNLFGALLERVISPNEL
jgi:AcrR family transcriptional regulator